MIKGYHEIYSSRVDPYQSIYHPYHNHDGHEVHDTIYIRNDEWFYSIRSRYGEQHMSTDSD